MLVYNQKAYDIMEEYWTGNGGIRKKDIIFMKKIGYINKIRKAYGYGYIVKEWGSTAKILNQRFNTKYNLHLDPLHLP